MKYKLLLLGTNGAAIDDIFQEMEDDFELQTTSMRFNDIKCHVKYFQPHAIIYCLYQENRDSITKVATIKQKTMGAHIPYVIIGNQMDCDDFNKQAVNIANLTLKKPLTAATIRERLTLFLDNIHQKEENISADIIESDIKKMQENLADIKTTSEPQKSAAGEPVEKERKTILIVDDDIRMVRVIKRYLETDYNVASAVSGSVALRYLSKRKVDLILLDYMMPEMDGPQVLQKLHEQPATANIPVIFLTGAAERDKIQKALSLSPQGYLLKPINGDKLMTKIRQLIGS